MQDLKVSWGHGGNVNTGECLLKGASPCRLSKFVQPFSTRLQTFVTPAFFLEELSNIYCFSFFVPLRPQQLSLIKIPLALCLGPEKARQGQPKLHSTHLWTYVAEYVPLM